MPQQVHTGISVPGPQGSQGEAIMGWITPGAPGPSLHALSHLNPSQGQQVQLFQELPAPVSSAPDPHPNRSHQQTQFHAMLPPTSHKHLEPRRYTAEDWDIQKAEITRLYEENKLERVMELMRELHGLTAT
jgi:hypothetical protein